MYIVFLASIIYSEMTRSIIYLVATTLSILGVQSANAQAFATNPANPTGFDATSIAEVLDGASQLGIDATGVDSSEVSRIASILSDRNSSFYQGVGLDLAGLGTLSYSGPFPPTNADTADISNWSFSPFGSSSSSPSTGSSGAIISPPPEGSSRAATSNAPIPTNNTLQTQSKMSGRVSKVSSARSTHSGENWSKNPPPLTETGGVALNSPYVEYSYIDIEGDTGTFEGHSHVVAVGYGYANDFLFLDFSYEYANQDIDFGAFDNEVTSHSFAGSISGNIIDNFYGFFILGYSTVDDDVLLAGGGPTILRPNTNWYINPGLGHNFVWNDFVFSVGASYLKNWGESVALGDAEWDQFIADFGASYQVSDTVVVRGGMSYNTTLSDNFVRGVLPVDGDWWTLSLEVGADLPNGLYVYGGYGHELANSVSDNHTFRLGAIFYY